MHNLTHINIYEKLNLYATKENKKEKGKKKGRGEERNIVGWQNRRKHNFACWADKIGSDTEAQKGISHNWAADWVCVCWSFRGGSEHFRFRSVVGLCFAPNC